MEAILSERILGASAGICVSSELSEDEAVDAGESGVLFDSEDDAEEELLGESLPVEDEDLSDDSLFAEEEFPLPESLSDLVSHDSEGFEKAICQRAGMPLSETTTM